ILIVLTGCPPPKETGTAGAFIGASTNIPPIIVTGPFGPGSATKDTSPGPYTGKTTFKDSNGSTWFTPPAGTTICTITDISNLPSPYASKVESVESGTLRSACASTSVTFSVTSGKRYNFTIYVVNTPPPPTSGQTLSL